MIIKKIFTEVKANIRLRIGLWLVVAIAWIYAIIVASDALQPLQNKITSQEQEIIRLQPFEREKTWLERKEAAQKQNAALRTWLWEAKTVSLAEATLRDWVKQSAERGGLTVQIVEASAIGADGVKAENNLKTSTLPPGMQNIRVHMVSSFNSKSMASLLALINGHPKRICVERLYIRNQAEPNSPAKLEIDLRALFLIAGENSASQ